MSLSGFVVQLSWRDFPAGVPANASPDMGAFVSSAFKASTPWSYVGNPPNEVYTIGSVTCTISLNRTKMWARTSARTASLLQHEQGHFEITALLVRQMDRELSALLTQSYSGQSDLENAVAAIRDPLAQVIADLQSTAAADGTYDVSTNHGLDAGNQAKWTRAFQNCRTSATGELVAALTAQGITI